MRDGFNAAGDGGAMTYTWQGSPCSLGNTGLTPLGTVGQGDNGYQVGYPQGGSYTGCWIASLPPIVDAKVWGVREDGMNDDTSVWQRIDTAFGIIATTGSTNAPYAVTFTGVSAVANLQLSHIRRLIGARNGVLQAGQPLAGVTPSTFTYHGAGASDLVDYVGSGPLTIEGVSFSCPIFNVTNPSAPACANLLLIQPAAPPVTNVLIRDATFTGGTTGLAIKQSGYLILDRVFTSQQYGNGVIVASTLDSQGGANPQNTQHIQIRDLMGRGDGHSCLTLPVGGNTGTAAVPRDVDVQGVGCEGAGFLSPNAYCFELGGTSMDSLYFDGWAKNCALGGIDIHRYQTSQPQIPDTN